MTDLVLNLEEGKGSMRQGLILFIGAGGGYRRAVAIGVGYSEGRFGWCTNQPRLLTLAGGKIRSLCAWTTAALT